MDWSAEYSVHIDEIDAQHKVLFEAITELEHSINHPTQQQRWSNIHYALVKLQDFVRIHFAVEEALLRILKYPAMAEHLAQHRDFEAYLHEIERRSLTHEVGEEEIVAYLRSWLEGHIKHEDNRYSRYFTSLHLTPAA